MFEDRITSLEQAALTARSERLR